MAINPMYFQVLSPQQANPMLYGLQAGTQIAGQNLQNAGRGLQNQLLGAQVPYAGQMAQADLGLKQAQVPYMQSQTALNVGTLPYLGMKFAAPYLMAQAKMAQAGIQNQNSFATLFKLPGVQQLVQQRPDIAQSLVQAMNNSAGMINSGIGFSGAGLPNGAPQPPIPMNGNYNNQSSYPVLPGGTPPGQQQNQSGMTITPQQVNQLRNLAQPGVPQPPTDAQAVQQGTQNDYLDKNLSKSQRQAMVYENVVDGLLKQNQQQIQDVSQFSGLAGHAGQTAGKYAQAFGLNNSQQYRNFSAFTHQTAPMIANEVRRAMQGQATDKEITMMNDIADPTAWDKDPQQVLQEFNTMVSNLRVNGQQITKTPVQTMNTLNRNLANPVTFGANQNNGQYQIRGARGMVTLTDADIAHTAQQYKMSIAQVKQQLGIS